MLLALLLAAEEPPSAHIAAILAEYHAGTRAAPSCNVPNDKDEISVCANRRADRWRMPDTRPDTGEPSREAVPAERARYVRTRTPCEDRGPFLVGCGMAGVSMTMGFGGPGAGKARLEKPRLPAR